MSVSTHARYLAVCALLALLPLAGGAQERSLEDVKREVARRAATRTPPFDHVREPEVTELLRELTSLDREEWGSRWCRIGLAHEARGDALRKQGAPAGQIREEYELAFGNCLIGRYPVPSSPAKRDAYVHARRMFLKAAEYFDVRLEVLTIPFETKSVVAYLQVPKAPAPPAVVMYWGGVDVWKEDHQRNAAMMHRAGLATLLIDGPGTGENPVAYTDPAAERVFLSAIDHLAKRSDVAAERLAVWGRSFGAYWAAKLAHVAPSRLRGAVFHGGNVHFGFQEEWLRPALTKTAANYLLGPSSLFDARSFVLGVSNLEDIFRVTPKLSLLDSGLLDKPSAPLLIVNGKLDDQAPIADSYLLMEHGSPKEVRIVADGGHMGVRPGVDPDILAGTIVDWLKLRLTR